MADVKRPASVSVIGKLTEAHLVILPDSLTPPVPLLGWRLRVWNGQSSFGRRGRAARAIIDRMR